MNNEDMSDIIQKLSNMMNNSNNYNNSDSIDNSIDKDISSNSNENNFENLQNILSNINFNSNDNENNSTYQDNNFNIDFETVLKMKKAMDIFNSNKNSPETNLLLSLKPYLNNNRKQKLDQYMQFLNLSKVIEAFNFNGGVNKNDISK